MTTVLICNDVTNKEIIKPINNPKILWFTSNGFKINSDSEGFNLGDNDNNYTGFVLTRSIPNSVINLINHILSNNDTIWNYKFELKSGIIYENNYKIYKLLILLDNDKLLQKINEKSLQAIDYEFLHRLLVNTNSIDNKNINKIYKDLNITNNNLYNFESWKNEHNIKYEVPLIQPNNILIKLFKYQLKTLHWMKNLENYIDNDGWSYNSSIPLSIVNYDKRFNTVSFDMINKNINSDNKHYITTKGGVLADEMGLGKTITTISLTLSRPSLYKQKYAPNGKFYTKANLVICPSHLTKQWYNEIEKCNVLSKKILLLTKPNHENITYQDFIDADYVIVSLQFLMNASYYVSLNYKKITNSYMGSKFTDRKTTIDKLFDTINILPDDELKNTYCPMLEHFHWYRIIIDEAHELFSNMAGYNITSENEYIKSWLTNITSNYKWFISGTPFVSENGFQIVTRFLDYKLIKILNGVKYYLDYDKLINEGITFGNIFNSFISNAYYRNTKEAVKNEYIVPPIIEDNIMVKLTEIEKSMYETNKHLGRLYLRQLCCSPNISDQDIEAVGDKELTLEEVRINLIKHKEKSKKEKESKLQELIIEGPDAHAFEYRKKKLEEEIKQFEYLIKFFNNIDPVVPKLPEDECPICYCEFDDTVITECGHYFCKECIYQTLKTQNKSCPTCRNSLNIKNIYPVTKSNSEQIDSFVYKYGSKIGKLISICKQLITDPENRIIIFSQWDRLLTNVGNILAANNIYVTSCKGHVHQRNAAIESFRKGTKDGKDLRVILLSSENAASGTNLVMCNVIILLDPIDGTKEEVAAIEGQAIGRAMRLGREKQLRVIRLITKDTIEEEIYNNTH